MSILHAGQLRLSLVFLLSFMALAASCGRYDPALVVQKPPLLDPRTWFAGSKIGYRTVMDRNGNIRETAVITRNCRSETELSGICDDTIVYNYNSRSVRREMEWKEIFVNDQITEVHIKYLDGSGQYAGRLMGPLLQMKGATLIPFETEKRADVETRLYALPGPGNPAMETQEFSNLGIRIGTVQTFWLTSP